MMELQMLFGIYPISTSVGLTTVRVQMSRCPCVLSLNSLHPPNDIENR